MSGSKFIRGDIRTSGTVIALDDTSAGVTEILKGTNSTAIELNLPSVDANFVGAAHGGDPTKNFQVDVTSSTPSTKTTLTASQTANRSIALPDASTTLVGTNIAQALTLKSIDLDNNTLTNIELDNFKSGIITTDLVVSATSSQLATAAAAKAYTDASTAASVPATRQVIAGTGLIGGGSLSSDITLNVQVDNDTLEISSDIVRVKDAGISNVKIAPGVNAAKIFDGTVTNTHFSYLTGASANIQSQINTLTAADALKIPLAQRGVANGVATLDSNGLIPSGQLPPVAITDTFVVASQAAQTALTAQVGDVAVRTDLNKSYILRLDPASTFSNWQELLTPTDTVLSVNGQTGVVNLTKTDVGLANVDNTSDATKNAATATLTNKTISGASNTITNVSLTTGVTGTLPIANGGTGQITATAAFGALSPLTTKGDILGFSTSNIRVPIGADGFVLTADSAQAAGLKWAAATAGSGSGEKNYIGNPNNATNWTASGAGITVTTESTVGNIPDNSTQTTGIKFLRVSGADYAYYRFTLDSVDYNKKLKVVKDIKYAGTAGDYTVRVFSNTASNYSGTSAELTVSPSTSIPTGTGQVQMSFDSSGSTAPYLEVRIYGVAGTTAIYMNNFLVGPGVLGQVPAVGPWQSYTPVFSNFGTVTLAYAKWRRVGESIEVEGKFTTGTNVASIGLIGLPTGYTAINYGTAVHAGRMVTDTAAQDSPYTLLTGTTALAGNFGFGRLQTALTPLVASALTSGAIVAFQGSFIANELAGSGTLNSGAGAQVEYAYFTGTVDADNASNGTASARGPQGAQMSALTDGRNKYVAWATPVQNGDLVGYQVSQDGVSWSSDLFSYVYNATSTLTAGVQWVQSIGNISRFQIGRYRQGTVGWDSGNYIRFYKVNASSPVGFGLANDTASGLVTREVTTTLTGTWRTQAGGTPGGTASASRTVQVSRVANIITVRFQTFADAIAGTGTDRIVFSQSLPSWAIPVSIPAMLVPIRDNNANVTTVPGHLIITTAGIPTIYRDINASGFSNGLSCGLSSTVADWYTLTYSV